eukprot:g2502.t1
MRRSSRRRPSSAAPSTTSGTLDRVAAILARRKEISEAARRAAAAVEPQRGPLFDSEAFSSHNARVKAWQPRFQSPSGSRSALRDIRKRKQALLEAEERHRRDYSVLSRALQHQIEESQQLRAMGLLAVRKAAHEAAEKTRDMLSAQQQLALQMVERKRARDVQSAERRRASAEDMSKATSEELSTTREQLERARSEITQHVKEKRERTVADKKELARLVTASASSAALSRVTLKTKEASLEASKEIMDRLKNYTTEMDDKLSRLRDEHQAEKSEMELALRESEARCAAAVAETEKVRQEFEQATKDWMTKVKDEYDTNLRKVRLRFQDANSRLEERLAQAEEKLMARATVTSALIDGVISSTKNVHQKSTESSKVTMNEQAQTEERNAALELPLFINRGTQTAVEMRNDANESKPEPVDRGTSLDASELIALEMRSSITDSDNPNKRALPEQSAEVQVKLLRLKLDEVRAELATTRRESSRRIESLQNLHAKEIFEQLSQHNESLSRAISSGTRALALAKQDHESKMKKLRIIHRKDLQNEQFKRQVAEIRADKKAALIVLQRCWRGALARSSILKLARRARELGIKDGPVRIAAEDIQRVWRGRVGRLVFERRRHKIQYKKIIKSQKRIVRAWREHKEYHNTLKNMRVEDVRAQGSQILLSGTLEVKDDDSPAPTSVTGKTASSPGSPTPYASPPLNVSVSDFMRLVREGNLEQIKSLIDHDASIVHWRDDRGRTALFYAQKPSTVDVITSHGGDVNARDQSGTSPLVHAVMNERESVCRLLIMLGADVRGAGARLESCGFGASALHCAAHVLNEDIIRLLLASGADPNFVPRSNGWTPLYEAVHAGIGEDVIKSAMKREKLVRDGNGTSPGQQREQDSSWAAANLSIPGDPATVSARAVSIVELLLHHGARADTHDGRGNTPLVLAVRNRNRGVVRVLLEHGSTPGIPGVQLGKGGTETFDMLAQESLSPLYASVLLEQPDLVSLLLSYGADPDVHSKHGLVPLHIAAKLGNIEIAQMLKDAHCDLSAVDTHGNTALHIAIRNRHALFSHTMLCWNRDLMKFISKTGSRKRIALRLTHRNDEGETVFDVATKVGLNCIFDPSYDPSMEDISRVRDKEGQEVKEQGEVKEKDRNGETLTEIGRTIEKSDEESSSSDEEQDVSVVRSANIEELLVLPNYVPVPQKTLGRKKVSWGAQTFGDERKAESTEVSDSVKYGERIHSNLESSIAAVQKAAEEGMENYYEDPEWVTFMDPSSGCPYYYNTITKVTQWELPEIFQ